MPFARACACGLREKVDCRSVLLGPHGGATPSEGRCTLSPDSSSPCLKGARRAPRLDLPVLVLDHAMREGQVKLSIHLHDPPPTAELGSRPAPPLQRGSKSFYKQSLPASAEDCLTSHVTQIEERQAERVREKREARRRHEGEMSELRDRVGAAFEEHASRRAWHQQVAQEQLAQADEKETATLLDYKEAHTGIEYWPYEAGAPAFVRPDPKMYGAELLVAAELKTKQKALQEALRRGGATSLKLRRERERERQAHDGAGRVAPADVRRALTDAAARKRAAVAEQAQQRQQWQQQDGGGEGSAGDGGEKRLVGGRYVPAASSPAVGGRQRAEGEGYYLEGDSVVRQMGKFQLQEVQRELRERQNKQALREVLAAQAADKRRRELREHMHLFGDAASLGTGALAKLTGAESEKVIDPYTVARRGAERRRELEDAIAEKQRERRHLRKGLAAEQKAVTEVAAAQESLAAQVSVAKKREQQVQTALELTKQMAKARQLGATS